MQQMVTKSVWGASVVALVVAGTLVLPGAGADPLGGPGGELECGTRFTPAEGAQALALHQAGVYDSDLRMAATDVYTVRLAAHIVRRTDGSGGLLSSQLSQGMDDLNASFLPYNMRFVLDSVNFIDDDAVYFADSWAEYDAPGASESPNIIDVYFYPQIVVNSSGYCGVSAFTFSSLQHILMANGCMGLASNPSTFPHEIGHYFDLFHTHEPFYGLECPSGSNCTTTGDLVCDTPADPRLTTSNVSGCAYTGGEVSDASCGFAPYAPDVSNLMSYGPKACRDHFSAGQGARARATLENLRPGYIAMTHPLSPADLTSDLVVDGADLAVMLAAWGAPGPGDLDGDNLVAGNDLAMLLAAWTPALP